MKNLYLKLALVTLLLVTIAKKTNAQYVTIPDANFVTYLQNNFAACMSGSQLDTTCAAVLNAKSVDVSNISISDLTGIQYFKGLDSLTCYENTITSLPSLPDSLVYLSCTYSGLTSLPALPAKLTYLNCSGNQLTSLPTLPAKLRILLCYNNHLTNLPGLPATVYYINCDNNYLVSIPDLPAILTNFYCKNNNLKCLPRLPESLYTLAAAGNHITCLSYIPPSVTSIDSAFQVCNGSNNTNNCPILNYVTIPDANFVTYLTKNLPSCMDGNKLDTLCPTVLDTTSMDVSYNNISDLTGIQYFKGLTTLNCNNNGLTNLSTLPPSITYLNCAYNSLDSLPTLPASLSILVCYNNSLSSLPSIAYLTFLNCNSNQLDSLPTLPASLTRLYCTGNQLQCLPTLPGNLAFLYATGNAITCLPNIPTGLTSFNSADQDTTYQVCNSPNGCAVVSTTAVTAAPIQNSLQVYPNPSAGTVTISCPFNATGITIAGMDGKIVYQTTAGNTSYNIDLSAIAKGVYVAQVSSGQGVISQKLVLQ